MKTQDTVLLTIQSTKMWGKDSRHPKYPGQRYHPQQKTISQNAHCKNWQFGEAIPKLGIGLSRLQYCRGS